MRFVRFFQVFFLLLSGFAFAQIDTLELDVEKLAPTVKTDTIYFPHNLNVPSLLVGYNGGHSSYGELGFALHSTYHFMFFGTKTASVEFRLGGSDFIMAPKIGYYFGAGLGIGLNALYYTNFDEGAFVFRPEIGLTALGAKIFYGYNWNLTNKDFKGINTHQLGVSFLIPLKKYSAKKVIIQEET